MIAAEQVVRASPDGYTLLVAYTPEVLLNKLVFKSMRYDPQADLTPVILAAQAPLVLAAGPKSGVSSMPELRAATGRPLTYASPGVGGQQHIAGELLQRLSGLNLTHVPYKGTGPAVTDLVGGQIDLFFATTPPLLAQIQAGKLKPLMVAGPGREKLLPNVPTAAEVGLPRLQLTNWFGVYAPKGMPPALLERLAGDIAEALADSAVVQALEGQGLTVTPLRGAAFASFIEAEMQKYKGFVSETGISAE
jgi:tripartite-type tricarboxylate transporter receptor subunit TctC